MVRGLQGYGWLVLILYLNFVLFFVVILMMDAASVDTINTARR